MRLRNGAAVLLLSLHRHASSMPSTGSGDQTGHHSLRLKGSELSGAIKHLMNHRLLNNPG
jgi:hypothetical protein